MSSSTAAIGRPREGTLGLDRVGGLYETTFESGENCPTVVEFGPGCGTVYEIVRQ